MTAEVWLINSAHRHSPAILSVPSVTLSPVEARGILHVTNAGSCSWFEFAREVLRQTGRGSIRVLPLTTAQAGRPAKRPAYSVLSPASLYAHGMKSRSWQEAIGAYLDELREQGKLG